MKALLPLLIAAAFAAPTSSPAESISALTWTSCRANVDLPNTIAARTECSTLVVPRDYGNPTAGMLALDVVRVVADSERGTRHDGALLLEPDEFASDVIRSVPAMAAMWLHAGKAWRDVSRRLDMVGLAQRRMDEADGRDCLSATSALPRPAALGTVMTTPNFVMAEGLALAISTACQNDPMHAHVGVRDRIEDVDRLREALGQPRLHLFGVGRGGWIATRYAERYPQHVGRMLLDSSWDIDGSVAEAMEARIEERGRTLRRVISQVVDTPERYGWGAEAADIHRRIGQLPGWAHAAWATHVRDVADLLALLGVARLLERDPALTTQGLRDALATTRLSTGDEDEAAARASAARLLDGVDAGHFADAYGFGSRAAGSSPAQLATALATRCNDGRWGGRQRYWRQRTRELHEAWPSSVGNETFQGMVCSTWPGNSGESRVPLLDTAPSFLLVHAEFDEEAPLRSAVMGLHGHARARMVVARGLRAHGVAALQDRPCASAITGHFLANGVLPDAKLTNCALPEPISAP
jgi:pimeloyl-ACP methyl ester carboxylesterase